MHQGCSLYFILKLAHIVLEGYLSRHIEISCVVVLNLIGFVFNKLFVSENYELIVQARRQLFCLGQLVESLLPLLHVIEKEKCISDSQ